MFVILKLRGNVTINPKQGYKCTQSSTCYYLKQKLIYVSLWWNMCIELPFNVIKRSLSGIFEWCHNFRLERECTVTNNMISINQSTWIGSKSVRQSVKQRIVPEYSWVMWNSGPTSKNVNKSHIIGCYSLKIDRVVTFPTEVGPLVIFLLCYFDGNVNSIYCTNTVWKKSVNVRDRDVEFKGTGDFCTNDSG